MPQFYGSTRVPRVASGVAPDAGAESDNAARKIQTSGLRDSEAGFLDSNILGMLRQTVPGVTPGTTRRRRVLQQKLVAGLQRMPRQKFRRAHAPAAFALQFQYPQRVVAAGDHDTVFVR